MIPNYRRAATKANETLKSGTDPLEILNGLPNVRVIPLDISPISGDNCDAFTCVRRKNGSLQYIVVYNSGLPSFLVKKALARELAHIILSHDGNSPEEIWSEEANCFAYHFICPKLKRINYKPQRASMLWELKDIKVFDSIEKMKQHIAEEETKFDRFIGKNANHKPADVELREKSKFDSIMGWKNCCDVVVNGKTVGYCGE